jgi:hypothetical protein
VPRRLTVAYAPGVPDDFEARPLFVNMGGTAIPLSEFKDTEEATASPPLVQLTGGSAIYLAEDGSPPVVFSRHPGSAVPDARLSKNAWDLTTISAGIAVGGLVGHIGAVVGGVLGFAVGRVRSAQVRRS